MDSKDVAAKVVERIIAELEKGVAPWRKPWTFNGIGAGEFAMPRNFVTKKSYRGINVIILGWSGYALPYWLTYRQAKEKGGHVRKGEAGTTIVFWKRITVKDRETGEDRSIALLRYYTVFNVAQCEGLKLPEAPEKPEPGGAEELDQPEAEFTAAERIAAGMPNPPAVIHRAQDRAYYNIAADTVTMPEKEQFHGVPEYFETLFHELVHSTGHKSRLHRPGIVREAAFGLEEYGKEELVAELGAAILCNMAGLPERTTGNAAAYCDGWLRQIKAEPGLLISAASDAQRAVDYILNTKFEPEKED